MITSIYVEQNKKKSGQIAIYEYMCLLIFICYCINSMLYWICF